METSVAGRAVVIGFLTLGGALALLAFIGRPYVMPRNEALRGPAVLAVLPFDNPSGDAELELQLQRLHAELISSLQEVEPDGMDVLPRSSTLSYRASTKSTGQIVRELSLDFLVAGEFRPTSENAQAGLTVGLLRAVNGDLMWSKTYLPDQQDLLVMEVGRVVAEAVRRRREGVEPPGPREF